jgi:ATP-dependent helicase/nuclease subunit A
VTAKEPRIDEATRLAQRRASDPRASAWVSANAGAGKTKVLADRVVRLLLSGTPPGRILCLTFTKAAAATMAIRIHERLGRWAALEEEALSAEIAELSGEPPGLAETSLARRLFARTVETPGGLKIETLHAFCERLLHLVPFEASVPARFAVLDEAQSNEALSQAIDNALADAASGARPDLTEALGTVGAEASGDQLRAAIQAAACARAVHEDPYEPDGVLSRLRRALGLEARETPAAIERAMVEDGLAPTHWAGLAERLRAESGATTDCGVADRLQACARCEPGRRLAPYLAIFFTKEGPLRKSILTKAVGPDLRGAFDAEAARLAVLGERLRAARTLERTRALFVLGADIRRRVEALKARRGVLDFDDLIAKTLQLVERSDADWLLYKLDRGIDHVLLDEAQDTNPQQWAILRRITEDFTAGHGARGRTLRTLFAVGDPKQSIYSFQGAAPHEFEESRRFWRERTLGAEGRFEDVRLSLSFRSAGPVLTAVDETFAHPEHFKGLSFGDDVRTAHTTARPEAPGLVELWPTEVRGEGPELDAWTPPNDPWEPPSPFAQVAMRVAKAVKGWTTDGDEWGRVHRAGDILVLVRTRGPAFEAAIRALREAGVPVAGQDRLDIAAHIAVLDLVAAGRAALLPADDLTLAAALKTPLVDLTDDDLVRIAADRPPDESLADALHRHAAGGDPAAIRACAALARWRALAGVHGPFGFYAALLGPEGGRAALLARLGGEAGDAIDVFLGAAQSAESGPDAPSLTAFLSRYEASGGGERRHTVKRDLESGRDEVRVMTVHGSKGLEAPIVILLDGCDVREREPTLVPLPAAGCALPVWSPRKNEDCSTVAEARAAGHDRTRDEHNRLLYVAMTRAKDRLVIAPYWMGRTDAPEGAWCEMVRRSLTRAVGGLVRNEAPYGPTEIWCEGERSGAPPAPSAEPATPVAVPDWLRQPVPPELEPWSPFGRSGALAAADAAERSQRTADRQARLRGLLIQVLLRHLPSVPPAGRAEAALAFLAVRAPGLSQDKREWIAADVIRTLLDEDLAPLFGPGSRAEAPIAGRVRIADREVAVSGAIDRLWAGEREVLVADYKTGASLTDGSVSPRDAARLAFQRALLKDIYPERAVRAFLIWTAGPTVRELTDAELDGALAAATAP